MLTFVRDLLCNRMKRLCQTHSSLLKYLLSLVMLMEKVIVAAGRSENKQLGLLR